MENYTPEVAELVKSLMVDWKERNHRHVQLLVALIDLTQNQPEQAKEGFTTHELHTAVSKLINKPWGDPDTTSKTLSKAWTKLETLWNSKKEGIQQRAQDQGLTGYPGLRKEQGGGGGHSSKYYLTYTTFTDDEAAKSISPEESLDPTVVRYYLDDMDNAGILSRWLVKGFLLEGWRKVAFLGLISAFLILMMITLWLFATILLRLETVNQFITVVFSTVVIIGWFWHFFGAFYTVVFMNTAIAPDWLQPLKNSNDDRLLVFIRRQPEAPNQIFLARYNATCPICDGNILVGRGGKEFKGRLIGRCSRSAREHVYSFDHYLRAGKLLRDI